MSHIEKLRNLARAYKVLSYTPPIANWFLSGTSTSFTFDNTQFLHIFMKLAIPLIGIVTPDQRRCQIKSKKQKSFKLLLLQSSPDGIFNSSRCPKNKSTGPA
ncbi:hypothetical protein GBA52_015851 [Prunus armeniaca]|nr:hypothetical protein GBA52_015851 [Prunus armeniaca]